MTAVSRILYEKPNWQLTTDGNNWLPNPGAWPVRVTGRFENSSTNNHWYRDHQPDENFDRGSNWTAFSSSFENDPLIVDSWAKFGVWFGYLGEVLVHTDNHFDSDDFLSLFSGWATSELDLYGLGSTAIAKSIPTNPLSDVPTAVAEILGEGLSIPGRSLLAGGRNLPRGLAGEYLGYEFGVLPLLSDLQKFARSMRRAEELIDRYASKSGKKIRKRYEFPVAESTVENNLGSSPATQSGQHFGGIGQYYFRDFLTPSYGGFPGVRKDRVTRKKETWFSGCFTYFLPKKGNSLSEKLFREEAEMRYLYGGISGNVAWELLPYSWAVDWLTNAGDVIHNVNAFARDGLVMPWGYVMERCTVHENRRVEGAVVGLQNHLPLFTFPNSVYSDFSAKYLRRRKATPFGFGLDVDGFTSRQESIIAALGIVKALA